MTESLDRLADRIDRIREQHRALLEVTRLQLASAEKTLLECRRSLSTIKAELYCSSLDQQKRRA